MGGGDFWSSLKSGLDSVGNFLKDTKLVSTLAPIVGTVLGQPTIGSTIGNVAKYVGLGTQPYRRKPIKRHIRGGILDDDF
jgi:hypothetical protein